MSYLAAFVQQIMTQLCKINPAALMWVPISTHPIVMDTGGTVQVDIIQNVLLNEMIAN